MKEKIKSALLFVFVTIIALLVITSFILSISNVGYNVFEFVKNSVLSLGNGNIFVGIVLTILALFGLANSIIGLFNPPSFLENVPQWLQITYFGFSIFGTIALWYIFINHVL